MSEVGDVVLGALNEFERHGWCRGQLEDNDGKLCAVGAVSKHLTGNAHYLCFRRSGVRDFALRNAVWDALRAHIPGLPPHYLADYDESISRVVWYNNSRTSYEEIREWFAKTAADEGITL
jgi:hypothetical protein